MQARYPDLVISPVSVKEHNQQPDPRRHRDKNFRQVEPPSLVLEVVQDDVRQGIKVGHPLVGDDQTQGGREDAKNLASNTNHDGS